MKKISIVICGTTYKEFDVKYSVGVLRRIFSGCEIILATNDKSLYAANNSNVFDQCILADDPGPLPSLKVTNQENNNVNRMVATALAGIDAASHDLVLRLRTDQLLLSDKILSLWDKIKDVPGASDVGRIITSSIFSINPRFTERMPYHIGDMLQFGTKKALLKYFTVPEFPFEYATWYERFSHRPGSNGLERQFRARYAVEQWLALHYIYSSESNFPINFHNHCDKIIITNMEREIFKYFFVASPKDLDLRASKFEGAIFFVKTQCYQTFDSLNALNGISYHDAGSGFKSFLYSIRGLRMLSFFWSLQPRSVRNLFKTILLRGRV